MKDRKKIISEKEIEELVGKKVDEKIESIKEKTELAQTELIEEPVVEEPISPKKTQIIIRAISEFRSNFHLCWKGSCRIISWITVPAYLALIILLLYCHSGHKCAMQNSTMTAVVFLTMVLLVATCLLLSIFSKYPKTALIFWILIDIPLIILVLIFTSQFIGLLIVALILLLRIFQYLGQGY